MNVPTLKRKIEDECRTFNKDWTSKYFYWH